MPILHKMHYKHTQIQNWFNNIYHRFCNRNNLPLIAANPLFIVSYSYAHSNKAPMPILHKMHNKHTHIHLSESINTSLHLNPDYK
jgi:hypothetical protein